MSYFCRIVTRISKAFTKILGLLLLLFNDNNLQNRTETRQSITNKVYIGVCLHHSHQAQISNLITSIIIMSCTIFFAYWSRLNIFQTFSWISKKLRFSVFVAFFYFFIFRPPKGYFDLCLSFCIVTLLFTCFQSHFLEKKFKMLFRHFKHNLKWIQKISQ